MRLSGKAMSVVTLALALLGSACAATPEIRATVAQSEQPNGAPAALFSVESTPPVAPAPASASTTQPLEDEPTSAVTLIQMPADANDGAVFDAFILEQFDDYEPGQLGALQLVVSSHCLGLVDESSIDVLTTDSNLQRRVLSIEQSTCDDVARDALLVRGTPTGASTLEEAVETRFNRVVWWYGRDEFRTHAERFCDTRPQRFSLDSSEADLDLSVSVEVELYTMVEEGECDLAASSASSDNADAPASESSSGEWAERFGRADGRAPLFATGIGGDCPAADDLWSNGFDINIFMESKDLDGIFEISSLALNSPLVSISSTTPREGAWDILTEDFAGSDVIDTLTTDDVFSVFGLVLFGYNGPDDQGLASLIESLRSASGVLLVTDGRCTDNAVAQLIDS